MSRATFLAACLAVAAAWALPPARPAAAQAPEGFTPAPLGQAINDKHLYWLESSYTPNDPSLPTRRQAEAPFSAVTIGPELMRADLEHMRKKEAAMHNLGMLPPDKKLTPRMVGNRYFEAALFRVTVDGQVRYRWKAEGGYRFGSAPFYGLRPGLHTAQVEVWTDEGLRLAGPVQFLVSPRAADPSAVERAEKALQDARRSAAGRQPGDNFYLNEHLDLAKALAKAISERLRHGAAKPDELVPLLTELVSQAIPAIAGAPQPRAWRPAPGRSWADNRKAACQAALDEAFSAAYDLASEAVARQLIGQMEANGSLATTQYSRLADLGYSLTGNTEAALALLRTHFDRLTKAAEINRQAGRFIGSAFVDHRGDWPRPLGRAAQPQPAAGILGPAELFDANPLFLTAGPGVNAGQPAEKLSPADLFARANTARKGAAADGVSRLVVRVPVAAEATVLFVTENQDGDGQFETLFNRRSMKVGEKFYAFGLYTPPASFGDAKAETGRLKGRLACREVGYKFHYKAGGQGPQIVAHQLVLARPPVLLVHGTFDTPANCWQTAAPDGEPAEPAAGSVSMQKWLEDRGCLVSLVDFSASNGVWTLSADKSSFADNARVLWANPGGLRQALAATRKDYELAVTQADVVAHSLGGLVARLWASDAYNPAPQTGWGGYRRADNFDAGDIHRLVTVATPHLGSDLSDLIVQLRTGGGRDGLFASAGNSVAMAWLKYVGGRADTAAVRDQMPHTAEWRNEALARIGPTKVPAHAVVCVTRIPDLAAFGGEYAKRAGHLLTLLSNQPEALRAFLDRRGLGDLTDDVLGRFTVIEYRRGFLGGDGQFSGTYRLTIRDQAVLTALMRAAVFGNTQNDMTVRVESQIGGLDLKYTSTAPGVLHGFAPRYQRVQELVWGLLAGDSDRFSPEGLPAPTAVMVPGRKDPAAQDPGLRRQAIAASGLVPSHAEAFSFVARQRNEAILVRPVNHDATRLIAAHNATKDMHVKGKSADWGPQKGYIAVEQRFSKLHRLTRDRDKTIAEFDGKVRECLAARQAVAQPLTVIVADQPYEVLVVADVADAEAALVLRKLGTQEYFDWRTDGGGFSYDHAPRAPPRTPANQDNTRPLQVLADRFPPHRLLTADYDLLAIATPPDRGDPPPLKFDPDRGYINPPQVALLAALNNAVRVRGNYLGGNVCHHGPENQYPKSPGVDFPVTCFEPSGFIRSIPEGPKGYRDMYIKRYFHQKISAGWRLRHNDVWRWEHYRPYDPKEGYDLRDAPGTEHDELDPDNYFDSDEGGAPAAAPAGGSEEPGRGGGSWLFGPQTRACPPARTRRAA